MINDDVIIKTLTKNNKVISTYMSLVWLNKHNDIKKYLDTRFPKKEFVSYSFTVKRILMGIEELPKCKVCGKTLKSFTVSYCSLKCRDSDKHLIEKIKQTKEKSRFIMGEKQYHEIHSKGSKLGWQNRRKNWENNPDAYKKYRDKMSNSLKAVDRSLPKYQEARIRASNTIKERNRKNPEFWHKVYKDIHEKAEKTKLMKDPNYLCTIGKKISDIKRNNFKNNPELKKEVYKRQRDTYAKTKARKQEEFIRKHNCTGKNELINTYGRAWLQLKIPEISDICNKHYIQNKYIKQIEKFGSKIKHRIKHTQSRFEEEVYEYIKSLYKGQIDRNNRKVLQKEGEIDIYISKLKLAIECNGDYWHSTKFLDETYHFRKSTMAMFYGIKLCHVWEHEWNENQKEIKQFLKLLLKNKHSNCLKRAGRFGSYMLSDFGRPLEPGTEIVTYSGPEKLEVNGITIYTSGKVVCRILNT